MKPLSVTGIVALVALVAASGVAVAQTEAPAADLRERLSPCRVSGLGEPALCGTFSVFEDRAAGSGRRIELAVALVPAKSSEPEPDPLFLFAGGPGQSIIKVGGSLTRALEEVRLRRDVVMVDQRGTGGSNALRCETEDELDALPLAEMLDPEMMTADEAAECLAGLDADPRAYTTPPAVDDVDDVRRALGYDRINLWGGSYGTRFALVYLRRHPEAVRSVVLDAVAPTTMPLPYHMARDAQRAMERLFEACAADAACAAAYPDLARDFDELLRRLEAEPARVTVAHPRTGAATELVLGREIFAGGLRGVLYDSDLASLVPLFVRDGLGNRFDGFVAAMTAFFGGAAEAISGGLMLSVLCAEDVGRLGDDEARQLHEGTFVDDVSLAIFANACQLWPHGEAAPGFGEPVRSDVPVLLLSGELDPVTPPSWAEAAAEHLPNSRHVVVPGKGHGVTSVGCVPELIADFLDAADASGLDAGCVERHRRPPFFLDAAGTPP